MRHLTKTLLAVTALSVLGCSESTDAPPESRQGAPEASVSESGESDLAPSTDQIASSAYTAATQTDPIEASPKPSPNAAEEAPVPSPEGLPIHFPDTTVDLGVVRDDPEVVKIDGKEIAQGPVHQFQFKVVSNKPVTIKKVITTCGCTAAKGEGTYQPGSEGAIEVRFDPRNRQGQDDKRIKVVLAEHPIPIELRLKAFVDAEYAIEPRMTWIGEHKQGEAGKPFDFKVICRDPSDQLLPAKLFSDNLMQEPVENAIVEELGSTLETIRGSERRVHTFRVTFTGSQEVGRFHVRMAVHRDRQGTRPAVGIMMGAVVGPLRASPDILSIQGEAGTPFAKKVRLALRHDDGLPTRINAVQFAETPPAGCEAVVDAEGPQVSNDQRTYIVVNITGTMPESRTPGRNDKIENTLILTTTHPNQPELKIPVAFYVRPPAS